MKARIAVEEGTKPSYVWQPGARWWNKGRTVEGPAVPDGEYNVCITLEVTEEERGIIQHYNLGPIVVDKYRKFDDIECKRFYEEIRHVDPDGVDEITRQRALIMIEVTIDELLKFSPYRRAFRTPIEAHAYSDTLKQDILPNLKKLIDQSAVRVTSETLEF